MRWQGLFDDIEAQLEHELAAEDRDLRAEEERLRLGRLGLGERLRAIADGAGPLAIVLRDGDVLAVEPEAIGRDWLAGELRGDGPRRSVVVPFDAIAAVRPDPVQRERSLRAGAPVTALTTRLGLAFVLRDLCRRRASVEVGTSAGRIHGTIDLVGRDHLELAEHPPGEPRRGPAVLGSRLIPFAAVLIVRTTG